MGEIGKKLPFNVRIPVLTACALAAGITLGCLFLRYGITLTWIIAVVPVAALAVILFAVFTKGYKFIAVTVFLTVVLVSGALNLYFRLDGYGGQLREATNYGITATVHERGENYIILTNVTADGEPVRGKIIAYLGENYGDYCDAGYKVKFTAEINAYDLFPYGKLNYNARDDIRYGCSVHGLQAEYRFSLFGYLRSAIKKTLYDNLDASSAAVTYAMLTGITYGIDDGSMQSFRYGGIAHIFAVSGLHIGIVYGITRFICARAKVNRRAFAVIGITAVFLYAGICGFSVSSVRAAIMCGVAALSKLFFQKYDGFNSLSLAVFLILLISPVSLFFAGFQLSVCAVAGILLLNKKLSKGLKKVPKALREPACVALSSQAGTLPVMLARFGYLSGAGILLNVILVPILSIEFVLLFSGTVISLIIPPAAQFVTPFAALPLQATVSFLITSGFENALIRGFGAGLFLPLYYALILLLSDKLNFKFLVRVIAVAAVAAAAAVYSVINAFAPFGGFKIVVSAYYGGGEVLIKSRGSTVLIVTEGLNPSRLGLLLNDNYCALLDGVIILGGENCSLYYEKCNLNCKSVYVYYGYLNIQPYREVTVNYEQSFTIGGAQYEFTDGYGLRANLGGTTVGISANGKAPENCDLLIGDCLSAGAIGFNERNLAYNVYDCGDFVFTVKEN